eukprot:6824128-Pyramimonas_sp.AAC.1
MMRVLKHLRRLRDSSNRVRQARFVLNKWRNPPYPLRPPPSAHVQPRHHYAIPLVNLMVLMVTLLSHPPASPAGPLTFQDATLDRRICFSMPRCASWAMPPRAM